MKINTQKVAFYLVCALFVFLPFSSWLVSLTGSSPVSLSRDFLIVLIFALSFFSLGQYKRSALDYSILFFLCWGALSFFWREAGALQWLKGFRFTFLPLIMFLGLRSITFSEKQKNTIYKIIFAGAAAISILAILQLLKINIPLTSSMSGGDGALESVHHVGNSQLIRLQSVLAGPNALGLYLLAIVAYCFGAFKKINQKFSYWWLAFAIILILSFSRSAIIGLIVSSIVALALWLKARWGFLKSSLATFLLILIFGIGSFILIKSDNPAIQNFLTHGDSSSLRVEQYQRIWQTKEEIGLLGHGSGTAGPSSQFRLDGGENHWTENIYLDIFEELGLVGLALYLLTIISAIYLSGKIKDDKSRQTLFVITIAFAVTGLFINYYTGQVGIFLFWLAAGLALNKEKS